MNAVHERESIQVVAPPTIADESVLTGPALAFVEDLTRGFGGRIDDLLRARRARQARFDAGKRPGFLPETFDVRTSEWRIAPIPADLRDRRVEITGPLDRKTVINALNSGAQVFMADFEDATAPTWANLVEGQRNLREAVRRTVRYEAPDTGKVYELAPHVATLMVRPRGLHLQERHVLVAGRPVPAALVDFGLFFFHNARALVDMGSGPYFYVPKLESHLEARLWNDIFVRAQEAMGLPRGTIRATVLIETLPAAFEMDEILFELREHSAGLNCGRWDYIFSYIKALRNDPHALLPDREQVTMENGFLRRYARELIETCHRRGAHALGGMAANIPNRRDIIANDAALQSVRADKDREARDGHDGTWVAHPALVPIAREVFDRYMPGPNQIHVMRPRCRTRAADLLRAPGGTPTAAGLRLNIRVGIRYLASWLGGVGCVALDNRMEDAATAEISRAQVWQWLRHAAVLDDDTRVTRGLVLRFIDEEMRRIDRETGPADAGVLDRYRVARDAFEEMCLADELPDFFTTTLSDMLEKGFAHASC